MKNAIAVIAAIVFLLLGFDMVNRATKVNDAIKQSSAEVVSLMPAMLTANGTYWTAAICSFGFCFLAIAFVFMPSHTQGRAT